MPSLLLLPGPPLYTPPIADTRGAASQLIVHADRVEGAVAREIPIVGQAEIPAGRHPLTWQVGLNAAAFMGLSSAGAATFDLLTFDGLFGLPMDVAWGPLELRLAWEHLSAHFADGVLRLDEAPEEVAGYSREWFDVRLGFRRGPARVFGGVRGMLHSADGRGGPGAQIGAEWLSERRVGPFAGVDLQIHTEHEGTPSVAAQAGVALRGGGGWLRLGVVAYQGPDDAGQLSSEEKSYVGGVLGLTPPRDPGRQP